MLLYRHQNKGMLAIETVKRGRSVTSLQGGVLSIDQDQNLVRLIGKNLKGLMRVWKLRLTKVNEGGDGEDDEDDNDDQSYSESEAESEESEAS